ncbi:IgGFc-binding protein-like [Ostrea edulis]|uniref:IgGFc-binding protein-like n=1 Tax=Ostrea edulis TaxID=37623 RepID=UPI0024AF03E3|nr:IgGFc-binding protein-like [Ostrea edulis]
MRLYLFFLLLAIVIIVAEVEGKKSKKGGGKGKDSGGKSIEKQGKHKERGGKSIEHGGKSKESGGKSKESGGKSKESGGKSIEKHRKRKERGWKIKKSGGKSKERGGKSKERGGKSIEHGGKSKESRGKSKEIEWDSKESGGESIEKQRKRKERGWKIKKIGGKSKESGGKSKEKRRKSKKHGGKSKGSGGKSKESGGKSVEKEGKHKESRGKSLERGGKSKESGGKSKKGGGKSKDHGEKSKESKEEIGESRGPNKIIICERAKKQITCPVGSRLRILSASYGRSSRNVCPGTIRTLRCSSKVALAKVRGHCDGRRSCELLASNTVYGDPCQGTAKYLDISYNCQAIPSRPPRMSGKPTKPQEEPPVQKPKDIYLGCYEDRRVRLLDQQYMRVTKLTISSCKELCRKRGKKYAGVEHRNECFCGNTMKKYPKKADRECSYPCSGNPKEKCGASWRINVYQLSTPTCGQCNKNAKCINGKCVCNRGYHGDGVNSCQKSCFCMASGDPHYKTYDGEMIHFMGTCKYTLTKSTTSNDTCGFHVTVKNEHRHGKTHVSYTRQVDVDVLGKRVSLRLKGVVMIDGEKKYLPVNELGGKLKVFRSGRYVQVLTSCGVRVNFDGVHAVSVTVPGTYREKLSGLCGDCNGKRDDMKTSTGRDVSKERLKYSLIGNSYEVKDDTGDVGEKCKTVEDDPNSFKCDKKMNDLMATDKYCGLIRSTSGPFAACIAKFPDMSKEYFESCRIDVCSLQGSGLEVAKCEAVEAFAEDCADNGVTVKWRTKGFCPLKCTDRNSEYRAGGSGCPATCLDPNSETTCTLEPQEGCFCKAGYLMSDGACVPRTQCGCKTKAGDYYPVGAKLQSTDCGSVYLCRNTRGVSSFKRISVGLKCHRNAKCGLNKKGERACVCNKGYIGDGYRSCLRKPTVPQEEPPVLKPKDTYLGCFEDRRVRLLDQQYMRVTKLTISSCKELCRKRGKKYAGVEHRNECFCGNTMKKYPKKADRECSYPCSGNPKEKCGASWRINVYQLSTPTCGQCNKNAKCINGKCVCNRGYHGDGVNSCQKSCFCMASGDPHYKTYDGEMIHFMGTCKYTLTKSTTSNDTCGFHVTVKNEHRHGKTHVSYTRQVDVDVLGKRVSLRLKGVVMIDGEKKYLPVNELGGKLKVFRSGRYVQVLTSCGVRVNFDGVHAVSVTVPGTYREKLNGLCGDCNGKRDDMKTSTGRDVSKERLKYSLIGNSYEVKDDTEDVGEKCKTVEDDPNSFKCDKKMNDLMATDKYCGLIRSTSGPFAACIAKFPDMSKEYFESCRIDVCSLQGSGLEVAKCEAVEAFAEDCADNGVTVKWRTKGFCPLKCTDRNSEYRASGSGCPATCLDPNSETTCTLEPQEGCFCKAGYLMSDGACVPRTQCGCKTKAGDYYPVGAKLQTTDCGSIYMCRNTRGVSSFKRTSVGRKCHRNAKCRLNKEGERACVCNKGYIGDGDRSCLPKLKTPLCGEKKCSKNASCRKGKCVCKRGFHGDGYNSCTKSCFCMASGDPHYKTYDGEMIHFMGTCKYTLTKSTTSNDTCGFQVTVKNEHRNKNTRVAFTRQVDLDILGKKISLRLKGVAMIDGEKKYLPVNELGGKLKVFRSGRYVQVWTSCGVRVNFDGVHAVSVTVPGTYRGKLTGLCGDCNGKRDDVRTSTGRDVSREKLKYSLIGNSYEVSDDTDDEGKRCKTEEDTPYAFTCDAKMSNLLAGDRYCGWIQNKEGPFAECITKFPDMSKEYFESCRIDVCSLEGSGLEVAKCEAVEAFAEDCADNGIMVKWRTKGFCPLKCEDKNAEYRSSGSGCPATCLDPHSEDTCTLDPTEGCFCKAGFVLSDGACVPQGQCGCKNDKGDYYPIGSKIQAPNCAKTYECKLIRGKATLVKTSSGLRCHRNSQCRLDENGERKCVCRKGFFGDGKKSCQPLCGGKYRCHKKAACKKGRCQCRKGLFGDGENSCEKMCTCSASGDPHYRTYDGQMIHFMGICKYTMTKSLTRNDPCAFSVEVKNEHRGRNRRVAYTRTVDAKIYGKVVRLAPNRKVYINGERKFLPVSENNGDLKIVISGRFIQLITKCNIYVNWDGKSVVQVGVPKSYSNKMEGLCGNCDGRKNDYRTKEGVDVSWKSNKYVLIGKSYEVFDDSDKPSTKCKTFEDDVQCSSEMLAVATDKNHCGYLNPKTRRSSPFNICLAYKPTLAFQMYESCIYDVCSYFDDVKKRSEASCRAAEGLEAVCETSGFMVQWRSSAFCPIKCGANQRYSAAVSGCPATCTSPGAPDNCRLPNTEGCECLPGFLFSGTSCVRETECGCQAPNGDYIPLNAVIVSDDCTTTKKCIRRDGESLLQVLSVNTRCHFNGLCGMNDGVRQCVCKEGYSGDGVNECKKLCGGKYLCHKNARCDNGMCQCNNGLFGDGILSCQESCTCMATGDPHYRTFDGQMIHFMGECKYTLSQFKSTDKCSFNVEVKNVKRHQNAKVSFTRLVDVKVPGYNIRLLQEKRLIINGIKMFAPWTSPNGIYKVTTKGRYITVTTICGVVVSFDGVHSVSLSVPKQYGGHLTGLCGNCNSRKDDLRTKAGDDVSTRPNKFSLIGDSYQVFDDMAKPGEKCTTTDSDFKCSSFWSKRAASKEFCGILLNKSGPFANCIKADENLAKELYESCVDDVCSYEDEPAFAMKSACMAGESLAEMCLTKGLGKVLWRKSDFCPLTCPENSVYNPAIVGCPRTCTDPEGKSKCDTVPQEGCECADGYVLSGEKCVLEDECGCFYNDQYFPLNSYGPLTNCEIIQKCVRKGGINKMTLTTRHLNCHKKARCRNVLGDFTCQCNRGFEGDGKKECKRTDEPVDDFPLIPEEPSGTQGEKCRLQTTYSTCGSTIKLTGDCEYQSDILAKCQYSIVTASSEGQIQAVLTTRGRRSLVSRGKTIEECIKVTNEGTFISISDDVCQRCTVDYLRSLIPNQTCKAP